MKILLISSFLFLYHLSYTQSKAELQEQIINYIKEFEPDGELKLSYYVEFNDCRLLIKAENKADNSLFYIYRFPMEKLLQMQFVEGIDNQILMKLKAASIDDIYVNYKGDVTYTNEATIIFSKNPLKNDTYYQTQKRFYALKKMCIEGNE